MQRYLSILKLFWGTALAAEMEYRLNFILATCTSIGSLAGSIFGLFLFYRTGYTFQGWQWQEALIVLGFFTIMQGFAATFLMPNLNHIVDHVQQGTLDFILLKPISSQFWLSTRSISIWGFSDLIFGIIIIGYAGIQLNLKPWNYLVSLIPLLFAITSLYSLWFMLGATTIWFIKTYNITDVLRGLLEAGRYPMVAYPSAYRVFFTFVVPVAFLTTVPAEAMLNRGEFTWIIISGILAITLLFASIAFWRFALRFYTSASS